MGDAEAAEPKWPASIVLDGYSRAYRDRPSPSALQRAAQERPLGQALQPGLSTATAGAAAAAAVSITVDRKLSGQPQVGLAQLGLTYEDARQARVLSGLAISRLGAAHGGGDGLVGERQDARAASRRPLPRTPSSSPATR